MGFSLSATDACAASFAEVLGISSSVSRGPDRVI